ncbi:hypothetical protein TH63_16230 [Rufibacter radiotolerans]|uniref:Uncharacterized protein n=1 Tax=Rufibacter radiotolerans TaxID=1379910 RepID=A0A0H4VSR9_9BACT|nr:hypothetical protein [Rufibacter radiotolerans]AKQ46824.1 hypothetical protein TH63_16230 [Rufibacter radiotolerans]
MKFPFANPMRFKLLSFFLFFCFLFGATSGAWAQAPRTEAQVVKDFLRYLSEQAGQHNRVDKTILPVPLADVYLNDSLLAKVNFSDESRIMARQGWFGAGPMLRLDYKLSKQDFAHIKNRLRKQDKFEWTQEDFPENIMVLQQLSLAPATYYAYSYPIVLLKKNLVLVKRHFHSERSGSRWTCLEVYRITKPGHYQLENCYLRTDR